MSPGERWIDEAMAPIANMHPPAEIYNPIYSAVGSVGQVSGPRLVKAIVQLIEKERKQKS